MHTDRKIGFAMGILLIGIVAALFFRNEPLIDTSVAKVSREQELNERLRERDVAVYLQDEPAAGSEIEENDEPQWSMPLRDVLRNMDARNKSMPSPVGSARRGSSEEEQNSQENSEAKRIPGSRTGLDDVLAADRKRPHASQRVEPIASPTENPLPPLLPVVPSEPRPEPQTGPSSPTVPTSPSEVADSPQGPEFDLPAEFDEYVVKYGDTLSGIAQKMLGSQGRYLEIYEANRDRMSSPDRLDVGKPLRIPRVAGSPPKTY